MAGSDYQAIGTAAKSEQSDLKQKTKLYSGSQNAIGYRKKIVSIE